MSSMSMSLLLGYPALDKALQVCFPKASQRTRITCWQCFVLHSPGYCWLSLSWRSIAGWQTACPPCYPGPFTGKLFFRWLALSLNWRIGLFLSRWRCISLYWTSWDSSLPISPASPCPSEWQHKHLFYQPLPRRILNIPKFVFSRCCLLSCSFLPEPRTPLPHGHYSQGGKVSTATATLIFTSQPAFPCF